MTTAIRHDSPLLSLRTLLAALLVAAASGGPADALDKTAPVHILPYGRHGAQLVLCNTSSGSARHSAADGRQLGSSLDRALILKGIAKTTPVPDVEFGLEFIYFLDRYQKTTAAGATTYRFDDEGPGDLSLSATWQVADSRSGPFGLILGGEVKTPTGNAEKGLGTGSWDFLARTAASLKTGAGFPYLMAFYSRTGSGELRGVAIDPGDELFAAAGFRSRLFRGFGAEARVFTCFLLEDPIRENAGAPARLGKNRIPGVFLEGRWQPAADRLEFALRYEASAPTSHDMTVRGAVSRVEYGTRTRTVGAVKLLW